MLEDLGHRLGRSGRQQLQLAIGFEAEPFGDAAARPRPPR